MFFLFEQLMMKYDEAMSRWKREGEKWVSDGEEDRWNHRYFSEWARSNHSPKEKIKNISKIVLLALLSLFLIAFFIFTITESASTDKQAQDKAYVGHSCKAHEIDDRVKIKYGPWKGATGVIIGGCGHHEDYQVKLDKQMYNVANDGNNDPVEVEGRVLSVDTYKNLIKIEKE